MEPSSVQSQMRDALSSEISIALSTANPRSSTKVLVWRGVRNRVNDAVSALDLGLYGSMGREV